MVSIGSINLRNPVLLAPMAGVTDLPLRRLAWRLGAGLVYSEMIGSRPELWDTRKSQERRERDPTIDPWAVQIAGSDPEFMATTAQLYEQTGADIIDINMGCPAKKVCKKEAGSALLRDPGLVKEILEAVVSAVSIPVTLKTRTGWSPDKKNAVEIACIAENVGVQALTLHGRTRACRFEGIAEHETAASVVSSISIPVFVNGDIRTTQDALCALEISGAAGVMVGRAALGSCWLPGQIAKALQSGKAEVLGREDRLSIALEHLSSLHRFYGSLRGVRIARKHIKWFLQSCKVDDSVIKNFNRIVDPAEQKTHLEQVWASC